jgi:uncharacterized integral membrane protein
MKLFRRLLAFAFLLVLVVAVFQNQQSLGTNLEFSFLKWTFGLVLGFWIFFAILAGAVLFALISTWKNFWMRLEIRKRDQEIARLEKELAAARKARYVPGDEPLK